MTERMKILIASDGSECADEAIESLRSAGLPPKTEALVISVADVILPPAIKEEDKFPPHEPEAVRRASQSC